MLRSLSCQPACLLVRLPFSSGAGAGASRGAWQEPAGSTLLGQSEKERIDQLDGILALQAGNLLPSQSNLRQFVDSSKLRLFKLCLRASSAGRPARQAATRQDETKRNETRQEERERERRRTKARVALGGTRQEHWLPERQHSFVCKFENRSKSIQGNRSPKVNNAEERGIRVLPLVH